MVCINRALLLAAFVVFHPWSISLRREEILQLWISGHNDSWEHRSVVYVKHRCFSFYPRPVLAFGHCHRLRLCVCVFVCVCVSLCQSLACPRDNSGPVQTMIAKFVWNKDAKALVNILFFGFFLWGGGQLTLTFKVKFNLKSEFTPFWACPQHYS